VGFALGLAILISVAAGASALATSAGEVDAGVVFRAGFRVAHGIGAVLALAAASVAYSTMRA
jgi:hypothetical protein